MLTTSRPARSRWLAAGAVLLSGWCASAAWASFPQRTPTPPPTPPPPPFQPPPPPPVGVLPRPPIVIDQPPPPPPPPPPVSDSPEPGTLVLGLIGAGAAGLVARRKRKAAE